MNRVVVVRSKAWKTGSGGGVIGSLGAASRLSTVRASGSAVFLCFSGAPCTVGQTAFLQLKIGLQKELEGFHQNPGCNTNNELEIMAITRG